MDKFSRIKDFHQIKSLLQDNGGMFLNGKKLNGLQSLKELKTQKFSKEKSSLVILLKAILEIAIS